MQRIKNIGLSLLPVVLLQLPFLIEVLITHIVKLSGNDLYTMELHAFPKLFNLVIIVYLLNSFWKYPIFVWALIRMKRRDEDDDMPKAAAVIIYVLAYIAINIAVSAAVDLLSPFLIKMHLVEYTWTEFYERANFEFIGVVLTAPVTEEFLFWGRVYHYAGKIFRKDKAALVYQALLFGVAHFNLYQGIHSFFMGLILGCCYRRTGSLKLCILLHAASNLCSLILLWSKVRYR